VEAARAVFAEQGLDASLDEIARRAETAAETHAGAVRRPATARRVPPSWALSSPEVRSAGGSLPGRVNGRRWVSEMCASKFRRSRVLLGGWASPVVEDPTCLLAAGLLNPRDFQVSGQGFDAPP
jgi:hypothetical protein